MNPAEDIDTGVRDRSREDEPEEARSLLSALASALFPAGVGDLSQITWEPTASLPIPRGPLAQDERDPRAADEARLRAAELRFRTLVEQIPAVTFMAVLGDGENEIWVSPYIESLLGFTQKEWLENPFLWFSQLHPDDRAMWMEEFARGVRTGGPFRAECRLIARDGRVVWVRGEARVIKDERGRPLFLQGVAFDITESRRAHERVLERAVRRTELHYRDLVERLGAIFWEADVRTGEFTFVSEGVQRILGVSPARWIEDKDYWIGLVHPMDRDEVAMAWRQALEERTDREFEFRALTADDQVVWLQNRIHFSRLDEDDVHLLGVILDTTDRKRFERQLAQTLALEREARAEAEALNRVGRSVAAELELAQLVRQLADLSAELTRAEWAAFCRLDPDRGGGDAWLRAGGITPSRAFRFTANDPLVAPIFAGRTVRIGDLSIEPSLGRADSVLPYDRLRSYLGVPVIARSGEVTGGLIMGHSIANRFDERHERVIEAFATQAAIALNNARLYEAAERARDEAEAASRVKDEFLATMSHELRTPLNAVLGWATILQTGNLSDAMRERALTAIKRNAEAQAQIVEDLLDISRIVTGKLHLNVKPVDLAAVIGGALETVSLAVEAKRIRVATIIDSPAPAIMGDADRLRQVVTNLLTNAVKFTPPEGRIEVRLENADGAARIHVIDSGVGIEPQFLPCVFERFRQADGSYTRAHGGLGLGLAIVRHLVELHGGSVRAESPGRGMGATFSLELPASPPAPHASRETAEAVTKEPVPPALPVFPADASVLIVDDQVDAVEVLTELIGATGTRVHAAYSGEEALRALAEMRFDLLLFDIAMPKMDGFELIRRVRAGAGPNRDTPAAAMTSYARPMDRQRAIESGFQAHIAKPIDCDHALAVMAELIAAGRPATAS